MSCVKPKPKPYKKSTKFVDEKGRMRFACTECGKDYSNRPNLSRHQRFVHPDMGHIKSVGRPIDPSKRPSLYMKPKSSGPKSPAPKSPAPKSPSGNQRDELMQMFKDGLISIGELKDLLSAEAQDSDSESDRVQWNPTLVLDLDIENLDKETKAANREAVMKHLSETKQIDRALQETVTGSISNLFDCAYKKQLWIDSDHQLHYLGPDSEILVEPLFPDGEMDNQNGILPCLIDYVTSGLLRLVGERIGSSKRSNGDIDRLFTNMDGVALMNCQSGLLEMMTSREEIVTKIKTHISRYQRDDVDFCLPAAE